MSEANSPIDLDLDAASAKVKRATEELSRLCKETWAGGKPWHWEIPANPDRDSDLLLGAAIEIANAAIKELRALRPQGDTSSPAPGLDDLLVVWRDNGEALVTTRKHPDDKGVNGPQCWPKGISGYYLATHCRKPIFHPSALAALAAPAQEPAAQPAPEHFPMGRMNCREEEGGFFIDIDDKPIFTCSRGSHSLDMAPGLTLPQAKSALFALGAKLLRVDERSAPGSAAPAAPVLDAAGMVACPFCGQRGAVNSLPHYRAGCWNARCVAYVGGTMYRTEEAAVAAWNTRAAQPGSASTGTARECWVLFNDKTPTEALPSHIQFPIPTPGRTWVRMVEAPGAASTGPEGAKS